ncbi:MAG: diguanylate cyclase [Oscillospiraceae bacterium]|nr:diguanylate cyclase [Oscillospiraceae bacterium]
MPETILIVNDSKFEREFLKHILKNKFEFLEAADGNEGICRLKERYEKIDLVLLDLVMPEMDGLEVLKKKNELAFLSEIPVIMLTGSEDKADQIQAFQLGANDYIQKPFNGNVVLSRIDNILASKRRLHFIKEKAEQFRVRSEVDQMTGLYNKTTTMNKIEECLKLSPNQLHAFFIVDIDNFKTVNDVEGHQMGDHTICIIAAMLSQCFRKSDVVGRIGGDEFAVLMSCIASKENARQKATELITAMKYKLDLTIPEYVSLSIGLSFCDQENATCDELFGRSDQALYLSKSTGKGKYTEYGKEEAASQAAKKNLVLVSDDRSVNSQIESASDENCHCVFYPSILDLQPELFSGEDKLLFLDLSKADDFGNTMLQQYQKLPHPVDIPVYAICEEENIGQYRCALQFDGIRDILTLPLEIAKVRKKIEAQHLPC